MAISRILGVLALLAAVGIGYARYNISKIDRNSLQIQDNFMNLTSATETSRMFRMKILERGASASVECQTGPQAGGFYPKWPGSPPMHLHVDADEKFTVLEGTMGYSLEGVEGVSTTGVTVPVGKSHTFWNADPNTILKVKVKHIHKIGRDCHADRFFENLAGLSQMYGEIATINPLQQFVTAVTSGIEYTFFPTPVRLFVRYVAVPLAKLVGYRAYYPEYRFPTS